MFEKLDDYLVNIYMNQELNDDFIIFKRNDKNNYTIRGFLNQNDAYMLIRKDNKFGLRVNGQQYKFFYSRERFINTQSFIDIVENDIEYDEEELIEKYKDIEYVVVGEYDQQTERGQTISFLVNKSSYLVTDYFKVYEDKSKVIVSYDEDLLNTDELTKLHVLNPIIPNFDIATLKKDSIVVVVSDSFHENFCIKENMKDMEDLVLRQNVVRRMSNEAVEADRRSYTIIRDFDECAERINEIIKQRYGNDTDGR